MNLRQWIARHGPRRPGPGGVDHAANGGRPGQGGRSRAWCIATSSRKTSCSPPAGEVKVADFGLARLAGDTQATDLTQIGMTMGTPLYMSPEQVEGKPLDCRSDLYSFGVTCYHMLAGNPPFQGETALGVAVQHLKKEPQPLETLRPDLPPALCRDRPQDAGQGPGRPLAVAARIVPRASPRAAGILRGPGRRGFRRLGIVGGHAGRPAAGGQPATGRRHEERTPRGDGGRGGGWLLAAGLAAACCRPAAPRPGSPCGRSRCWPFAAAGHVRIPRQKTALAQYYCASQIGTEEAWQSVLEYFPEKESVVRRAKQQLARIYLREQRRPGDGHLRRAGRLGRRRQGVSGLGAGRARPACLPSRGNTASRPRCSTSYGRCAATCATSR